MKFRHRNLATALALTTGAGGALTLAGMPANAPTPWSTLVLRGFSVQN
jgi:hypothetical protein